MTTPVSPPPAKAFNVYEQPRRERPALKSKHLLQFDREFQKPAQADAAMRILEVGCGTGIFLRYLQKRGFTQVLGIDSDMGLAPVLADLPPDWVRLGDSPAILAALADASFDRICLFDVAEHIELPMLLGLMAELKRLLAPGGRIVMRVPNCSSPWGMKAFFGSFDHVTAFTPERMEELAAATGFTLVSVFGSDTGRGLRKLAQNALHALLDRMLVYRPDYWEVCLVGIFQRHESS
jgi:SAM-dependent methyltransferase